MSNTEHQVRAVFGLGASWFSRLDLARGWAACDRAHWIVETEIDGRAVYVVCKARIAGRVVADGIGVLV